MAQKLGPSVKPASIRWILIFLKECKIYPGRIIRHYRWKRPVQFAGHCAWALRNFFIIFYSVGHSSSHKWPHKLTFPDTIHRDTSIEDLLTAMTNKVYWKGVVNLILAEVAIWWWWALKIPLFPIEYSLFE